VSHDPSAIIQYDDLMLKKHFCAAAALFFFFVETIFKDSLRIECSEVFTVTFDPFNMSLLYKSIIHLKKI